MLFEHRRTVIACDNLESCRREHARERTAHMTAAEKVEAYLDRVLRYLDMPLGQRDPGEYEALMAMKSEIYTMSKGDATT